MTLPEPIQEKLDDFLKDGKTGNLFLHIKEGDILAWELKETGRIKPVRKPRPRP